MRDLWTVDTNSRYYCVYLFLDPMHWLQSPTRWCNRFVCEFVFDVSVASNAGKSKFSWAFIAGSHHGTGGTSKTELNECFSRIVCALDHLRTMLGYYSLKRSCSSCHLHPIHKHSHTSATVFFYPINHFAQRYRLNMHAHSTFPTAHSTPQHLIFTQNFNSIGIGCTLNGIRSFEAIKLNIL